MYYFANNNVYIENNGLFSIDKIFDCGQCFRFEKTENGFEGVAHGRKLCIHDENGYVVIEDVNKTEFENIWRNYFDIDTDYSIINAKLSEDSSVADALNYARGIRILRQDKWETLCSFIISQNNNIPRIKKIITLLCENFGKDIGGCFAFPDVKAIYEAGIDGLAVIRCGFRAKYIYDAAAKIVNGEIVLNSICDMKYDEAKKYLMQIKGVGPKVADCVLLFGYGFLSAFPKDVWIKKVIDKYYGESFDESVFTPYGGIAQQYLFYRERYCIAVTAN